MAVTIDKLMQHARNVCEDIEMEMRDILEKVLYKYFIDEGYLSFDWIMEEQILYIPELYLIGSDIERDHSISIRMSAYGAITFEHCIMIDVPKGLKEDLEEIFE